MKHPKEKDSKSTGVHCVLLAPEHVSLYQYSIFPDYSGPSEKVKFPVNSKPKANLTSFQAVLVFPDVKAPTLAEYLSQLGPTDLPTRLLFLDCTWTQACAMRAHPNFSGVPTVKLEPHVTQFWRPQPKRPNTDLATVEAVYYAVLEYHRTVVAEKCCGQYDNMLYFFDYFLQKIRGTRFQVEKEKFSQ